MILEIEQPVYYKQNGFIVRRATLSDVNYLSDKLRDSDVQEIYSSHRVTPYEALYGGLKASVLCLVVENNKEPVCMFGINAEDLTGEKALVWMLASKNIDLIQRKFLKHSKKFINVMLSMYSYLYNWTDARNTRAIEWLRFCGADIQEAKPFGFEQKPFHYFSFSRGS